MAPAAIEVVDLKKSYGGNEAVRGISFEVGDGELLALLGPNGAGKTTTVEILEGYRTRTSGQVRVLGIDPRRQPDEVKRVIGVQLQAASYFSLLTIEEILELFGAFYPTRRSPADLLDMVGLGDKRQAYVRQLSGGQQRRFSVAAALVNDPQVVFLDEPTTGLDPQMRHGVWELLRRLNRDEGKTVVLTTHYMEEAELLADRVAIIDHGQMLALDEPGALVARLGRNVLELEPAGDPQDAIDRLLAGGPTLSRPFRPGVAVAVASHLGATDLTALGNDLGLPALSTRTTVRPATLNDVFLHLTGREYRA